MYEVGTLGLAKIDTAGWKVRWATRIPLPEAPGRYLAGVQPQFFSGYVDVFSFRYRSDFPIPLTDAVITAVNDAGQVLVSCSIPPLAQNPVLLPHAGILLLPSGGSVAAYSAATGALRWKAAAEMSDIAGDTVYASTERRGGRVVAYDAASGRRLWSLRLATGAEPQALTVANGIVYLTARLPSAADEYALAIRARDGTLLWQRSLASMSPQLSLDAGGFLLALPNNDRYGTAQLIQARTGRLVASARTGTHQPLYWRSWSSMVGGAPVVVATGDNDGTPAFIVTSAHGYPATVAGAYGLSLAAVAQNVAYFISPQPCPPQHLKVTGVDIRSGRTLWSVRLPSTLCNDQQGSPALIPYDGGFAIPTDNGQVLLYR